MLPPVPRSGWPLHLIWTSTVGVVQIDHLIDNVKAEGNMALVRDFFEMIAQTDDKGR